MIINLPEHEWAAGCDKCRYGIVSAPSLTGVAEIYMERMCQAVNDEIEFCDCKAGICHRVGLRNRYRALLEEARKDGRMTKYAASKTHPDIESTLNKMAAARVPNIHYESEAV